MGRKAHGTSCNKQDVIPNDQIPITNKILSSNVSIFRLWPASPSLYGRIGHYGIGHLLDIKAWTLDISTMYSTDAIVLSIAESGEHDLYVSFYTKEFGKIRAKVRAARKRTTKQGAFLHEPAVVRISFVLGRAGAVLSGIKSVEGCPALSRNVAARGYALSFFALCNTVLYDGQKDRALWNLLRRVLDEAADTEYDQDSARYLWKREKVWLLSLLKLSGLRVDMEKINRSRDPAHLDRTIRRLLEHQFERSVSFFGTHANPEFI